MATSLSQQVIVDNVASTLLSDISASATQLTVKDAARFPILQTNQFIKIVIQDSDFYEIVYCYKHTGDGVLSNLIRAQDGTIARTFAAGSVAALRIVASDMIRVQNVLNAQNNLADLTNVNQAKQNLGLDKVNNTADAYKNVNTAVTLKNSRNFNITGAVTSTGTKSFNGSQDVTLEVTAVDGTKVSAATGQSRGATQLGAVNDRTSVDRAAIPASVGAAVTELYSSINQTTTNLSSQINTVSASTTASINNINAVLAAMWPVGSIYMNRSSSVNPGTFLPGSWTMITQGFLYPVGAVGAGGLGNTGGEYSHTLTYSEMPWHQHSGTTSWNGDHSHYTTLDSTQDSGNALAPHWNALSEVRISQQSVWTSTAGGHNHTFVTDAAGGSVAHNNMPPWLTVYMWYRVS